MAAVTTDPIQNNNAELREIRHLLEAASAAVERQRAALATLDLNGVTAAAQELLALRQRLVELARQSKDLRDGELRECCSALRDRLAGNRMALQVGVAAADHLARTATATAGTDGGTFSGVA